MCWGANYRMRSIRYYILQLATLAAVALCTPIPQPASPEAVAAANDFEKLRQPWRDEVIQLRSFESGGYVGVNWNRWRMHNSRHDVVTAAYDSDSNDTHLVAWSTCRGDNYPRYLTAHSGDGVRPQASKFLIGFRNATLLSYPSECPQTSAIREMLIEFRGWPDTNRTGQMRGGFFSRLLVHESYESGPTGVVASSRKGHLTVRKYRPDYAYYVDPETLFVVNLAQP